jgi:hypothetical protein
MIDYLPFFNKHEEFVKSRMLSILDYTETTKRIIKNYPGIMKVIQLNCTINFEAIHQSIVEDDNRLIKRAERDKLILHMISKLKVGSYTKWRFRCKIKMR